jgi:hypothetical protein
VIGTSGASVTQVYAAETERVSDTGSEGITPWTGCIPARVNNHSCELARIVTFLVLASNAASRYVSQHLDNLRGSEGRSSSIALPTSQYLCAEVFLHMEAHAKLYIALTMVSLWVSHISRSEREDVG